MIRHLITMLLLVCLQPLFGQDCSKSYDHVSKQALACFRMTGPQHGINLSLGSAGSITAPGGGSGSFTWDAHSQSLVLKVEHLPLWLSCSDVTHELDDFMGACVGTDSVSHLSSTPASDVWRIESPNVLQAETSYPQIRFAPLDRGAD